VPPGVGHLFGAGVGLGNRDGDESGGEQGLEPELQGSEVSDDLGRGRHAGDDEGWRTMRGRAEYSITLVWGASTRRSASGP
jgi:hypothetical protein